MTMVQEFQKKIEKKNRVLENCLMRKMIFLIFLKKELFRIKVMYLKQTKNRIRRKKVKKK